MTLLNLQGINKSFGALKVLSDIDLTVSEGQIMSVIGPNGAGKTTLFNVITGYLPPDSGKVEFENRNITGLKPFRITQAGLARSFQITNIFARLTVWENIALAAQTVSKKRTSFLSRATSQGTINQKIEKILDEVGLSAWTGQPAGTLSHGDQRHLEIGMTLATSPRLLMLDEPTSGMSPAESASTMDLIKNLKKQVTIMVIEHDMDLVMNLSDHIAVLDFGQKIAEGSPQAIAQNAEVRRVYLGEA
jgi:branched-chain amino acid transport system ATP-binding protein